MTDEVKSGIGFAIGAGMVPGIVAAVILRVILGDWDLAMPAGIAVWIVVGAIFWGRQRRPSSSRRSRRR